MQAPLSAVTALLTGGLVPTSIMGLKIYTTDSQRRGENTRLQIPVQGMNFVQRSRISEQVIKDGKAFYFWQRNRGADTLDLMELQLTGKTRSLMPANSITGVIAGVIAQGVLGDQFAPAQDAVTALQQQWLSFYRLTLEPYVASDHLNQHFIELQTPALPHKITFIGHFADPLQWQQDATNPFLTDWQLRLIVHTTAPSIPLMIDYTKTVVVT
jgi:hypothetical protein